MFALVNLKAVSYLTPPYAIYVWLDSRHEDIIDHDRAQGPRMRVPNWRISNIDQKNGMSVDITMSHPSQEYGNLTVYFESEDTKKKYLKISAKYLGRNFPFHMTEEDREG
jgi:hypothetical protein